MLTTPATEALGITYPIVQAGMARRFTNADLVAAVSDAGGLGVLGCLNRPADEVRSEIERIRRMTSRPFGVNFVVEHLDPDGFDACLDAHVPIFTFFRGAPGRVVAQARSAGAYVIYQVTTVSEAEEALDAGADMLVAQGSESGGHVGPIALSAILPAVVEVAGDRPVLAAGGIVDGGSLAAVLCLGAAGAWIGTRFLATSESPTSNAHKQAIVSARPGATVRSPMWDRIWGRSWPGVEVRGIRNGITDRWIGRDEEIVESREEILEGIAAARQREDAEEIDLLAGEGVGRISAIKPAAEVVREIADDADAILQRLARRS
jgi:nitronate monooxygenase